MTHERIVRRRVGCLLIGDEIELPNGVRIQRVDHREYVLQAGGAVVVVRQRGAPAKHRATCRQQMRRLIDRICEHRWTQEDFRADKGKQLLLFPAPVWEKLAA